MVRQSTNDGWSRLMGYVRKEYKWRRPDNSWGNQAPRKCEILSAGTLPREEPVLILSQPRQRRATGQLFQITAGKLQQLNQL